MPDLLLDTDVIIEVLRGNDAIIAELDRFKETGRRIAYTPIAKAEIYRGLRSGEEKIIERFFSACRPLVINDEVGEQAGRYLAAYHKSHGTEIADALVAASARIYRLTLFTINRKHFPMQDIHFYGD